MAGPRTLGTWPDAGCRQHGPAGWRPTCRGHQAGLPARQPYTSDPGAPARTLLFRAPSNLDRPGSCPKGNRPRSNRLLTSSQVRARPMQPAIAFRPDGPSGWAPDVPLTPCPFLSKSAWPHNLVRLPPAPLRPAQAHPPGSRAPRRITPQIAADQQARLIGQSLHPGQGPLAKANLSAPAGIARRLRSAPDPRSTCGARGGAFPPRRGPGGRFGPADLWRRRRFMVVVGGLDGPSWLRRLPRIIDFGRRTSEAARRPVCPGTQRRGGGFVLPALLRPWGHPELYWDLGVSPPGHPLLGLTRWHPGPARGGPPSRPRRVVAIGGADLLRAPRDRCRTRKLWSSDDLCSPSARRGRAA